jgi:hypothetical protein
MADTQINLDNKSFYLNYGGGWKMIEKGEVGQRRVYTVYLGDMI